MLLLLFSLLQGALAETADDIVAKARAANQVDSAIQHIRMTVISKSGSERVRDLVLRTRRDATASRTLLEVAGPSDLAGTKVLTIDNATGADETMLYLPTVKRVNLINSKNKSTRFIDSDLTIEDLQIRESANGTRTLVEDRADAWVIDTAMEAGSSYAKVRATIGKADLVLKKLELFDAEGVAKIIEVTRTEKEGAMTWPVETLVTDLKRGSKTKLEIVKHELHVGQDKLPDATFTRASLER